MSGSAKTGPPRFALWALGIGIVLMLGGFALMPLIPDAPIGVRMSVVVVGLGLFTAGLYAVRMWIVDQAQQDNDKRRRTK
jgi:hypothetical protein